MAYLLDTNNNSSLIFIKTRNLNPNAFLQSGYNTSFKIQLANPIICHAGESLLLSLYSASIPCSFYNITNDENGFKIDGIPYTIPEGNYNVRTLSSALCSTVNNILGATRLSYSYNAVTNKITLNYTGLSTVQLTTIAPSLGFLLDTTLVASNVAINVVNIIDDYSLYLRTNLNLINARDENGNFSDILERIPIKSSNSVVYYESPPNQHKNLLSIKTIQDFTVALTYDQSNQLVNLNGCDWELCLLVQTIKTLDRGKTMEDLRLEALQKLLEVPNEPIQSQQT